MAGVYNPTVTDCNGCTFTMPVLINDITGPVIDSIVTTDVTCGGDSNGTATVYSTGMSPPLTFIWKFGGDTIATNVTTVFGLWGGTYTVKVFDSNGCQSDSSFTINEPAVLYSAIISYTNVTCNGVCDGSATVMSGGGTMPYSYNWTDGQTTTTATGLCAGTHNVFTTDANGCTTFSSVQILEPNPLIITDSVVDVSCYGNCDGEIYLNVSGGTPFYNYVWNPCCGVNPICAGTYSVTVTDIQGCITTKTITINEPGLLLGNGITMPSTCNDPNGMAIVLPSGGSAPYSYLWNDPLAQTTDTAINLLSGSYDVIITDINGCSFTMALPVNNTTEIPIIDSISTTNVDCNGNSTATATVVMLSGCDPLTYSWDDPANQITPTATGLAAGNYTVTVTDSLGQSDTAIVTVNEPDIIIVLMFQDDALICYGDSTQISAVIAGGVAPFMYVWDNGLGNKSFHVVSPTVTTTYTLIVTDTNNCSSSAQAVTVTVNPPISVSITAINAICVGDSDTITTSVSGGSGGPYYYTWSTGAMTSSISISPNSSTTYSVVVSDSCSPNDTAYADVIVVFCDTTSIADIEKDAFRIYPNPNRGEFTIEFSSNQLGKIRIELRNLSSQLVFQQEISKHGLRKEAIQLEQLAKGIYILQVVFESTVISKKLIIE